MDNNGINKICIEHMRMALEQVEKMYGQWPVYQAARSRLASGLQGKGDPGREEEDQEALFADYEIAVAMVSYYMGYQDGFRQAREIDSGEIVKRMMDLFT